MTERMDFEKFWEDNCLDSPLFEDAAQALWEAAQNDIRTQLAACQAHNAELREVLSELIRLKRIKVELAADDYFGKPFDNTKHNDYQNSKPSAWSAAFKISGRTTDTEALDAAIAKAVEVCVKACEAVHIRPIRGASDEYMNGKEMAVQQCIANIKDIRARGKP